MNWNNEERDFDHLIGEDVFIKDGGFSLYIGVVEEIDQFTSGFGDSPSEAVCRLRDDDGNIISERRINCRRFS